MNDFTDLDAAVRRRQDLAQLRSVATIDASPDDAAESLRLSSATGVPALAINEDLPSFQKQFKAQLAGNIVRNNPMIAAYVQSNPLAANVSNDDYANLDATSSTVNALKRVREATDLSLILQRAGAEGIEGFKKGIATGGRMGEWSMAGGTSKNDVERLGRAGWLTVAAPIEIAAKAFFGTVGAVQGALYGAAEQVGGSQFGRDIAGLLDMPPVGAPGVIASRPHPAKAWIENGKEPPRGIDPQIDALKAQRNDVQLDGLDEALKAATASTTRERAPDLFSGFLRQHMQDAKIGINGDTIAALYGDKVPTPDDGILGWVPGLQEQLAVARETGGDVQVPIADWLAKVEPEVAKALRDDIRVSPGNITKREVALEAEMKAAAPDDIPTTSLDAPLPTVRGASALEPMFSIGDRKLKLARLQEQKQGGMFGPEQGFHDFEMVDEKGNTVGTINLSQQKGGKELYIEMINGVNGLGPRDFGPSLMRDVFRQLRDEFPEAEILAGHRVSGARDRAGTFDEPHAMWKIPMEKFSSPDWTASLADFKALLEDGAWKPMHAGLEAYFKPIEARPGDQAQLIREVGDFAERLLNGAVGVQAVEQIRGVGKGRTSIKPSAVYLPYKDRQKLILYTLGAPDSPFELIRHEAIHVLRQQGYIRPAEWDILKRAAEKTGWIEHFNIERRYPKANKELQLEEAIAEGFRQWATNQEGAIASIKKATGLQTPVEKVFQKVKDFFEALRQKVGEVIGKVDPTWKDLFEQIELGEVARREPGAEVDQRIYRSSVPDMFSVDDVSDMLRANATGLDLQSFKRLQKLIETRHTEDVAAAMKRAEATQRRLQSKEWKDKAAALRPEVVADIKSRPAVAADLFLNSGELFGQQFPQHRIRRDSLTKEQEAALPDHYLTTNKLSPSIQEIAEATGFKTPEELIAALNGMRELREASGKNAELFRRSLIDTEISRRMEAENGLLEKNIMEDAWDQALSETQLNILAEEMHGAGMMAKVETIDANVARAWAQEQFAKLKVGDISSDHFLTQIGKNGRDAERALIAGKPAEAVQFMQRKFLNSLMAKQAKELEEAHTALTKTAKRFSGREVKGIDSAFTDHIQALLMQAGFKLRLGADDIARGMEFHGQGDLPTFTKGVADSGWDPVVADWIQDKGAKPIESMTAGEFGEFKNAIDSLNHIGRAINKIEIAGEKLEFADFRKEVLDNITTLTARSKESQEGKGIVRRLGRWLYSADASLTRMEELVKDLDLRKDLGPLWKGVIEPMVLSKSKEYDLMTELSTHFQTTKGSFDGKWRKSLGDTIPQDVIVDPYTHTPYDMTRENLIQIMLNWGNRSNIDKYVAGAGFAKYGKRLTKEEMPQYEAQIKGLIDTHARAEDWEFVKRMWEPFKGWQKQMDTVARNTSGVAPKWVEIGEVETPFGNFEGGYWPVKYDPLRSNISTIEDKASQTNGVFDKQYFRAATSKGYLKERTGYVDFVNISSSLEQAASTMQQTIHDIAFRDALIQGSKVFYDAQIRSAIRKHYGAEYEAQLIPWLKRISYQYVTDDHAMGAMNDFLRRARTNLVGHALPLNLKVILSPDVGVPNPVAWARFEANRKENMALAMEKSQELRHLVYNLDRDYTEALNKVTAQGAQGIDVRKRAVEWGYLPVAKVSQEFRASTFTDVYHKAIANGMSEQDAILLADSKVRERHGAASVVDLPSALQSNEAMKMLTVFQGFFNTMYNWQRQIPGNVRRGEWSTAGVNALGSIGVGAAFGAVLFNPQREKDSWFKVIAKALLVQPLSTIPVLNSITSYAFEGFSPRVPFAGMLTAAGQVISDINKGWKGQKVDKPITHGANIIGLTTGLPMAQIGRTTQFSYDAAVGKQRPRNIGEYARGIITGEARLKP